MKQRFFSLLVCTALLLSIVCSAHTALAASSSDDGGTYTDPETGATFVVPVGWNEQELNAEASNLFQVQFVSQQSAGSTLLYGSVDLWNAATASERSGLTRSDFNSYYIYTLDDGAVVEYWAERFVQGAAGVQTNADINNIQLVTYGKNEFIEYSVTQEVFGIYVPLTVVFCVENGYMHIFMFSALGGTGGQATEDFHSVLASLHSSAAEGFRLVGGDTYTDPNMGTSFVIPEGWAEEKSDAESADPSRVKLVYLEDPAYSMSYHTVDMWGNLTESERSNRTRSDIDTTYAYNDIKTYPESYIESFAREEFELTADDIQLVTYGKNAYVRVVSTQEMYGYLTTLGIIMHVENGYGYVFTVAVDADQMDTDVRSMLSSVQIPSAEALGSGGTGSGQPDELVEKIMVHLVNFVLFLLELGVTFLIYALPFVVYRNAIRKRPVDEKALAIILVVLYEFVAWLLLNGAMSWFLRRYANIFIPLFWGWFSYRKMVRKADTDAVPEDAGGNAAPQQPIKAAPPPTSTAYIPTASTSAAPAPTAQASTAPAMPAPPAPAAYTPTAPIPAAPAAYIPAASAPAAPAPQTSPAAPAVPASTIPAAYIPAVSIPGASAPQTPSSPAAYTPASSVQQTPPPAPRIQFCRNCGFRLLDDSKFCSACGTPVVPVPKEGNK